MVDMNERTDDDIMTLIDPGQTLFPYFPVLVDYNHTF